MGDTRLTAPSLDDVRRALASHRPRKVPQLGRPAGVLVPVFERQGEPHLLLTQRTEGLSTHAGQISFPGGKPEHDDPDLCHTALRETDEELGIDPRVVEVVGELDDCPTFVTNFVITPFVGIIPDGLRLVPSEREIAQVIEAPLRAFLEPGALRTEKAERAGYQFDVHFYSVGGHTVWGATARVVHQFLSLLR